MAPGGIRMSRQPTLPLISLSRRSLMRGAVVGSGALWVGSRFDSAIAQDATPAAGPVEFLWESTGDPSLPLGNPAKVAIAPDDVLWVADGGNNQFQLIAPDGRFLERWGTPGSGEGEIDFTTVGWV